MTYQEIQDTAPEGLAAIIRTANGETHQDYERVNKLANLYFALITGEEDAISKYIRRFVRREDDTMFNQRCEITKQITSSWASSIMSPFAKVPRVNNITDKIEFETEADAERKYKLIQDALQKYYGDKHIDYYQSTRFIDLSFSDPNAFIVTEFIDGNRDANGNLISQVSPYPIEYSSEQAVNFRYVNNTLKWLCVKFGSSVRAFDNDYTLYMPNYAIKLIAIDASLFSTLTEGQSVESGDKLFIKLKNGAYELQFFEHASTITPAHRVGYKQDIVTKGRTFVSPLQPGVPFMMKSLKVVSEMDLTMALHTFPQKFQYTQTCTNSDCVKGSLPDGGKCEHCRGTGEEPIHTSAQDIVTIPMPRNLTDIVDLSKLVYYPQMQIELPKFQSDYIDKLKNECIHAVFNAEVFSRAEVVSTATEKNIEMESVYDTLYPFAIQYASSRIYQVKVAAQYLDISDIVVIYKFPKDLKFRSRNELINESKAASESGAPSYIRQAINYELAETIFVDNPDQLKRIRVQEMFYPFADKTTNEIVFIISNDHTTQYNSTLWANFDYVFKQIEKKQPKNGVYLYDMALDKIQEFVNEEVNELIANKSGSDASVMQ